LRRYNYFDDDDVIEEKMQNDAAAKIRAALAAAVTAAGKGLSSLKQKTADAAEKRRRQKQQAAEQAVQAAPAEAEETRVPHLSEQMLEDINNDNLGAAFVAPPVQEATFTAPQLKTAVRADTADGADAEELAHRITEAELNLAEREEGEVFDAIRAFSHKSGDHDGLANPVRRIRDVAGTVIEKNPIEIIERVSAGKRFLVTVGLLIFTVLFFVGVVFFFMRSINAENDRIKAFNANAGEVCADYVMKYGSANYENLYNTYGVQGFRMTGLCFARELDFDGDGSSELMLCYLNNGEYYNDVWGYTGSGDFENLFSEKAAQSEDKSKDSWSTLYYKNNRYLIAVHDPEDITKVTMFQLKNGKFSKKFDCAYDEVAEAYAVDDEPDFVSFERIRLSVLRAEKAIVTADEVSNTLETFSGTSSVMTAPGTAQSINDAYYTIVQEYNKRYGVSKYTEKSGLAYVEGLAVVQLVDFDNDGQNELLLVYRKAIKMRDENSNGESVTKNVDKYFCDIYRYNGSRAVLAYSNEGISNAADNGADVYFMLRKTGKTYNYCINTFETQNYGRELYGSTGELEFNGTEFKSVLDAAYEEQYGYSEYYISGDSVKKSVFEDTVAGVALFGENGDSYNKNEYLITYVQRKTGDAGDMKQLPGETEKAIKQLNSQYQAN